MTKYSTLGHRLAAKGLARVTLTFEEVESLLGFSLPRSARLYPAWWANVTGGSHSHAQGWLAAGFETRDLDLGRRKITFVRR